jgi:epoxyqueuosine reductase
MTVGEFRAFATEEREEADEDVRSEWRLAGVA